MRNCVKALRVELQHLQKTQGSTTLFVTHDQIEALTMADRIAVLNEGRIIQIGTPEDIYDRPASTFVAQLVGSPRINLYKSRRQDDTVSISDSDVHLPAPDENKLPSEFPGRYPPGECQTRSKRQFYRSTCHWPNHSVLKRSSTFNQVSGPC